MRRGRPALRGLHGARRLVMGAGGYRVKDYMRVGTPLTVIVIALIIGLVPVFFPW